MRSRHDLSGYCTDQDEASNEGHKTHMLRESLLGDDDETSTVPTSEEFVGCHEYTDDEIFNWNFNYWTVGFLLFGIQFSHVDIGPMKHFTLAPSVMKTWGAFLWTVFVALILFGYLVLKEEYEDLQKADCLTRYLIWLVLIVVYFIWNTKRNEPKGRHLHIHHYVVGFIVVTLIGYQSPFMTFLNGYFTGMYIEGGCRWGYDPIWTT